ncbi:MAG: hypothetical protein QOD87_2424 [Pseudonocardiales bacterium]|nr:hypothetical protein [Pseudonocardiales bacterium]
MASASVAGRSTASDAMPSGSGQKPTPRFPRALWWRWSAVAGSAAIRACSTVRLSSGRVCSPACSSTRSSKWEVTSAGRVQDATAMFDACSRVMVPADRAAMVCGSSVIKVVAVAIRRGMARGETRSAAAACSRDHCRSELSAAENAPRACWWSASSEARCRSISSSRSTCWSRFNDANWATPAIAASNPSGDGRRLT